jgi:hypothetical protein
MGDRSPELSAPFLVSTSSNANDLAEGLAERARGLDDGRFDKMVRFGRQRGVLVRFLLFADAGSMQRNASRRVDVMA